MNISIVKKFKSNNKYRNIIQIIYKNFFSKNSIVSSSMIKSIIYMKGKIWLADGFSLLTLFTISKLLTVLFLNI